MKDNLLFGKIQRKVYENETKNKVINYLRDFSRLTRIKFPRRSHELNLTNEHDTNATPVCTMITSKGVFLVP